MEQGKSKNNKVMVRIIFFVGILFLCSCGNDMNQDFFEEKLGLNINIKEREYSSDYGINPQGEGFSIDIFQFEISEEGSSLLKLDSYPIKYSLRENWKISKWEKTPLKNKGVLELLFEYQISDKTLKSKIEELKILTESESNLISYYYRESDSLIYSLDFYLISLKEKKIYIIEVFT